MAPRGLAACLLLAIACAATTACVHRHTNPFDQAYEQGNVREMTRIFDADSALWRNEQALFRTAIARATPGGPVYDLQRARTELQVLLARFPESSHRPVALSLTALIGQLEKQAARSDELSQRVDSLEAHADSAAARTAEQRRASFQLLADLRRTQAELQSVQEELERLKAVDLRLSTRKHRAP
jgi:chromosome segregation ATPase